MFAHFHNADSPGACKVGHGNSLRACLPASVLPPACSLSKCRKSWSIQSRSWYQFTCLPACFSSASCMLTFKMLKVLEHTKLVMVSVYMLACLLQFCLQPAHFQNAESPGACRVGHGISLHACLPTSVLPPACSLSKCLKSWSMQSKACIS
jgi:hypothetical protein